MPALTHNRVKNGFNGGIRKNNATAGTKFSRTLGSSKADATRSKALVGGIGSVPANIRAAYRRRVLCNCEKPLDVIAPIIAALIQITTPGINVTPSFDFSSNEVGTITSNYVFTSTTNAVIGSNTIIFSNLASGTYSDVFVQVTDSAGNMSKKLILDSFVINDTVPPVLSAVTQIATPGNDNTPSFVFTSNEAGTITSSQAFTSTPDAIVGDNTITFGTLIDDTYTGVTVQITDATGNVSNVLTLDDFVIDTVSPVISAVTPIATPGNDSTPSFVFTSDEAGTITSSHAISPPTSATVGNNTITFSTLVDGTYNGVTVEVTDAAGNVSNVLTLADFVIETSVPTLSAVTQITPLTNDNTPSFVFTSTKAGTITSSNTFTSTTSAISGDNTITFSTLGDDTYNTVWVKVTDSFSNTSNQLILNSFVIDTVAPTIAAKTPITTPTTDTTPSFVFTSNEAGTISSSHAFTSTPNAINGDNTITFDTLADDTYNTVWVEVTDDAGNTSGQLPLDPFTIATNVECLTMDTNVNIVESSGKKYVFNGGNTYDADKKYGLNNAIYTFIDIPMGHPLAILNNGNANITYTGNDNTASPIIIKVSGGDINETNGDFYVFNDENNNTINLGNGTFRFMRGKTYKFQADGIGSTHPFKIYMSSAFVNDNNGSSSGITDSIDSITITIPANHSTTAGDLYYQCGGHIDMKKDLSLLNKSVTGTTNDASYDFFYGDIVVTVSGDFGNVSTYCYYHGYMGGENLLEYKSTCSP